MESAKGPDNAMRPGGKIAGAGKAGSDSTSSGDEKNFGSLPASDSVQLPEDWLNGLTAIIDFQSPLDATFDISQLRDLLSAEDGKMVLKRTGPASATGKLMLKERQLGLGETVALKTNLSCKSPADKRLGIAIGDR